MLVLDRMCGEAVVIGKSGKALEREIVMIVKSYDPETGVIRLCFDAPKDVPIHRHEIFQRLSSQGKTFINDKDLPVMPRMPRAA